MNNIIAHFKAHNKDVAVCLSQSLESRMKTKSGSFRRCFHYLSSNLQGSEPATFVSPEEPNTPKRTLTVSISEIVSFCISAVTGEVARWSKAWSTKRNRYSDTFQFKQETHPWNKQPALKGGITLFPSLRNDGLVEGWLLFPLLSSPCSCNLRFQLSPLWLSAAWEGEDRRSRGRSWLS